MVVGGGLALEMVLAWSVGRLARDGGHIQIFCLVAGTPPPGLARQIFLVDLFHASPLVMLTRRPPPCIITLQKGGLAVCGCAFAGFNVRGGHHLGEAYSCFNVLECRERVAQGADIFLQFEFLPKS